VWSNALGFTVPAPGGNGLTLQPSLLNMVVGDTHTIQALSAAGQSVTEETGSKIQKIQENTGKYRDGKYRKIQGKYRDGKYRDSLNCVTYSDGPCSSAASFKMAQIDPHVRSLGAGVSEMLRSSGCPGILISEFRSLFSWGERGQPELCDFPETLASAEALPGICLGVNDVSSPASLAT